MPRDQVGYGETNCTICVTCKSATNIQREGEFLFSQIDIASFGSFTDLTWKKSLKDAGCAGDERTARAQPVGDGR